MHTLPIHPALLVAMVLLPTLVFAQPRPDGGQAPAVTPRMQFEGHLPAGQPGAKERQIALRQFSILPRQREVQLELPGRGLLLVQLRAGGLTTVIGGERQRRLEGEWWTASPPSAMRLETGDDTVVVDTILILDQADR
jgi:hypothetical protein